MKPGGASGLRWLLAPVLVLFVFVIGFSAAFLFSATTPEREIELLDELLYMVGDIPPFNLLLEGIASASGTPALPVLDVKFDGSSGRGFALERRPDGTRFLVNFSLFSDGAEPRGLFVGGASNGAPGDESGVAFYDGLKWRHLWCTANEGIAPAGGGRPIAAPEWTYISGGVERATLRHVRLISEHEVNISGLPLRITRRAAMRANEDFFTLVVTMTNISGSPITFDYAYGDEPWVGEFGGSYGDIGWHEGGPVKYETYLSPTSTYAGFWDYGNDEAGESHTFDNYANFIEWHPTATEVYFSNDFNSVNPSVPLKDAENRVLNIVWKNQGLGPGESKSYGFAIGMARIDGEAGLPRPPKITPVAGLSE